jgi:XTP/dITP diphosphohydrolase
MRVQIDDQRVATLSDVDNAVPPKASGRGLIELVTMMDVLRRNCPWDSEQTHRSLARYLLEETYETLEAIELGDPDALLEELGDVLLQVLFHSRIAAEADPGAGRFDIDDVAFRLRDKLVARHPHVFASDTPGGAARSADEVRVRWEEIKAEEKSRSSVLDGIPMGMPGLALADKLVGRAQSVRVDVGQVAVEAWGIGGQLLQLVTRARAAGVDPEQAMRDANQLLVLAIEEAETWKDAAAG